ncbi:MAG: hypothetical protein FJ222_12555 [Lentisphaerae bacterium]|nr:hypothetical protein [Lentisphaerota bacterium]
MRPAPVGHRRLAAPQAHGEERKVLLCLGGGLGQTEAVSDAQTFLSAHHFAYDPATLALTAETIIAAGQTNVLTRTQDALGRPSGLSLGSDYSVGYGYDSLGRFHSVTSSVFSVLSVAHYSYLPNSDLISGWSNGILQTVRSFESNRSLITAVENRAGSDLISRFDYAKRALSAFRGLQEPRL